MKIRTWILFLLTVLFVVGPWFLKPGYLFFTDFAWGPNIFLRWGDNLLLHNLIIKFFSLAISIDVLQKIYISFALFACLFAGRKIAENFIKNKYLVFVVSLFFLFNPFVYDRLGYGQIVVIWAYAFTGLSVGYLLNFINKNNYKSLLFSSLFAGLAIQASRHFVFFLGLIYFIFILSILLQNKKFFSKKILLYSLLSIVIIVVLNFNWILANSLQYETTNEFIKKGITEQHLIAFQTVGNSKIEVLKNVIMMSGFWGKDQFRYLDITKIEDSWGRSFLILLPLIIFGIIIAQRDKDKKYLWFGIMSLLLISIILAIGIRMFPAREITYWLFDNFPLYKGMRESQKWVALIVITYFIFLCLGAKELFKINIIKNNKFIISLFLAGVIIMQAPLILWGFGGQIKPVEYPNDWHEINKLTQSKSINDNKECGNKILFLPWHMYMSFDWIGNIVANPAKRFFDCPVVQGTNMEWGGIYDNSGKQKSELVNKWLMSKGENNLFFINELNIKYIILAKEVDWKKYLWIEQLPYLRLVKETETLKLYERQQ